MEKTIDIEKEAEKICLWGAARAGVIVVAPLVGTMALMANEVYMIMRLGEIRGVKLEESAVLGLLYSLGGSFVGQTLVTLIPLAPIQVPVGIAVTYGVGKVANAWLKAGQPQDIAQFKEVFEEARDEGMAKFEEIAGLECKDKPLGDESRSFKMEAESAFQNIKEKADSAAEKVEGAISGVLDWFQPLKEKSGRWLSAQKWEDISHGGFTIPYEEINLYLKDSLAKSDFVFKNISYYEDAGAALTVAHKEYGSLKLFIVPEEFIINKKQAYARLRLVDFAVDDNKLLETVAQTLGSKLIMSIVNKIFNDTVLEHEDFVCTYANGILEVYFTELIRSSKIANSILMGKNILDLVQFVAIVPSSKGIVVKTNFNLKKD
ncbi:MAG: hypothetical protein AB7E34_03845 [Acidaminococcaceae bacterium]